jgi:hypothetical protein
MNHGSGDQNDCLLKDKYNVDPDGIGQFYR